MKTQEITKLTLSVLVSSGVALALACGAHAQTGTTFCNATANSSGSPAVLSGSFATPARWDLHLEVAQGVPTEFAYMLAGPEATSGVAISNGLLCLVGTATARVYRYNVAGGEWNSLGRFDSSGVLQNLVGTSTTGSGYDVPLTVPDTVPVTILSGDTWNFQLWYRDTPAGLGTSNFSTGLSVTFGPRGPGTGFVPISSGTFSMGSSAAAGAPYYGDSTTQPVHDVTITQDFWMGKHEVTQAEYQALMGTNPSSHVGPNYPVEGVSWGEALAYCRALTAQEAAAQNLPTGYEYRLPTEAEWEYACRAGTTTEFNLGSALECGDANMAFSAHSNTVCNATNTVAVGTFAPNAWGLYGLHGNVREWCLDGYQGYSSLAVSDPFEQIGWDRVIRGGSWALESEKCRSAYRSGDIPALQSADLGFRVVLAEARPLGMVPIPAGTFEMGSNAASGTPYYNNSSTQPVHSVTISKGFWMGEHEVTQAEYQALMGVNPSYHSGVNLPVELVSWNDARDYCAALTAQEIALGNVPAGYEYRLPTEAEWEYACRGGTTTEYNVGAALSCADAKFWISHHGGGVCGSNSPGDVGGFSANAFGLYDMHGNVWEWCLDSYSDYTSGAVTDPFENGLFGRVIRGGSYWDHSDACLSAKRESNSPGNQNLKLGFRVVLAEVISFDAHQPVAGMVSIPAGTFDMGSDAASGLPYLGHPNSQPVHSVTISQGFWMGEHEVTQAEYQALMGVNPSSSSGINLPVERVSWYDASAYCAALTAQEMALDHVPAGYEYRLPTEAEWEYACRAGTTTEFNLGAELYCSDANFWFCYHSNSSCNSNSTVDVGGYPANAFGLYDIHGNVSEWCLDSYASYTSGAVTDPFVTGIGSARIIRGGSATLNSNYCRSAARYSGSPGDSSDSGFGFRVVLGSVLVP